MDRASINKIAEHLILSYREILCIDPFYRIRVETVAGDFISLCLIDIDSTATWILKLNPDRHVDLLDIKQSVIDCLVQIIFRYVEPTSGSKEALARIGNAFSILLPDYSDDESEEDNAEV